MTHLVKRSGWLGRIWPAVAVVLAGFIAYAGTLDHELVWDDHDLVRNVNNLYRDHGVPGVLSADFRLQPQHKLGYYRPVVLLSLLVDARINAPGSGSYHLTNVLLHITNSLLVLVLLGLLVRAGMPSLWGALIFALHPIHTESVAFVSGRTDLLATLFVLTSTIFWITGHEGRTPWRRTMRVAAASAFLLAGLSKEVAFMLPGVLAAWDALSSSERGWKSWWKRNSGWLSTFAAAFAVILLLRWGVAGAGFAKGFATPEGASGGGAGLDIDSVLNTMATYVRLLVVPWPLKALYTSAETAFSWLTLAGLAAFSGLCAAACSGSNRRVGIQSVVWIGAFLLPVAGIVRLAAEQSLAAERYLYLPSVGVALALAAAFSRLKSVREKAWASGAVLLLLPLLATATRVRAEVWKDETSLYGDIISTTPTSVMGYYNLGVVFREQGRHKEAEELFKRSVAVDPRFLRGYDALRTSYREQGRLDEAASYFGELARRAPEWDFGRFMLGEVLFDQGRFREAISEYQVVVRLAPNQTTTYLKLGLCHLALGDVGAAEAQHQILKSLDTSKARQLREVIDRRARYPRP